MPVRIHRLQQNGMRAIALVLLVAFTCCGNQKELASGIIHDVIVDGEVTYRVVRVNLDKANVALHWKAPDGTPIKTFERLSKILKERGVPFLFAANAGIFETDYSPTGLHVENGATLVPLNRKAGEGNFYLKPNGVFYVSASGAGIVPTDEYDASYPGIVAATQSGPLLLRNGKMHPAFVEDSAFLNTRSAVGVLSPKEIVFVLSKQRVSLYTFAIFLRDRLNCPDALYLDGAISQFYVPKVDWRLPKGAFAGFITISARE